ncbi:alpha-ketoacid dehydrogenase subunit beta [Opitutaceae bacterium TAV4]|uniref:alpha-ketoacid dehydrogenase subunit beta n=1 Tax=Geminisphaera colitermitum TaxID=1148786 RepID=UPI000158C8DB|nr:alpha-ketoacid dehydrogenase subunit beta [Geminisphaera colitermitum]RRK01307.1 alpha-ketoacid dehydrogenase subunit beta [Opitutaceae bacterium TAV4]RRK01661.1 alpha-ketoacid dehydrogenase subunit beta [Opitutaceae bacterium TAV3]
MPVLTYREAVRAALAEELERDENVVVLGEEVGQFHGAYKVSEGLLEKFGPKRIVDTPISEAGFIGLGVGASMLGIRPVMELMFWSFYSVAFDQILNNAANIRYMSGGQINCPIVIRGPANGGTNVGATHSHTPENVLANHPGVKVVVPATPRDAKGLLKSAIRDNDPVFFLENTLLYGDKGEVSDDPNELIPLGLADVKREGTDLTIVTYGRCVQHSLAAAAILEKEHEISVEIVDLRTIRPLDFDTVLASVKKTNRVLIVEEQKPFASVGSQLAYMIQREAFDDLDGPIHRLATIDAPAIYSPPVEAEQLPNTQRVLHAALAAVNG